jgi:hypothetical protein
MHKLWTIYTQHINVRLCYDAIVAAAAAAAALLNYWVLPALDLPLFTTLPPALSFNFCFSSSFIL